MSDERKAYEAAKAASSYTGGYEDESIAAAAYIAALEAENAALRAVLKEIDELRMAGDDGDPWNAGFNCGIEDAKRIAAAALAGSVWKGE